MLIEKIRRGLASSPNVGSITERRHFFCQYGMADFFVTPRQDENKDGRNFYDADVMNEFMKSLYLPEPDHGTLFEDETKMTTVARETFGGQLKIGKMLYVENIDYSDGAELSRLLLNLDMPMKHFIQGAVNAHMLTKSPVYRMSVTVNPMPDEAFARDFMLGKVYYRDGRVPYSELRKYGGIKVPSRAGMLCMWNEILERAVSEQNKK